VGVEAGAAFVLLLLEPWSGEAVDVVSLAGAMVVVALLLDESSEADVVGAGVVVGVFVSLGGAGGGEDVVVSVASLPLLQPTIARDRPRRHT
jgi:hypothetical protein